MLWQQRMYTLLLLPIYIPESGWRSALTSGRHAIYFHKPRVLFLRITRCRLVFVLVAFPPPPVTSPATRLESRKIQATCYLEADHFLKARPRFYPQSLKISSPYELSILKPSLSASAWGVNSCNSRLSHPSNIASPQRLPLPSLVTTPMSTATRVTVIQARRN